MSVDVPAFGQASAEASWLRPRLTGDLGTVTGTVPAGFVAYARILHPVEDGDRDRSWAEIATEAGTTIHPLVQWHRLIKAKARDTDQTWHGAGPDRGNLVPSALGSLLDALELHTATPDDC